MANLPTQLSYGRIHGRIVVAMQDGSDPDDLPDPQPATGTFTITPDVPYIIVGAAQTVVKCPTYTVTLKPEDDGLFSVAMIATDDPDTNPTGFTYTVDLSGVLGSTFKMTIQVPSGSDRDLTEWLPAQQSSGVITLRGPKGDKGDPGTFSSNTTGGVAFLIDKNDGSAVTWQRLDTLATKSALDSLASTVGQLPTTAGVQALIDYNQPPLREMRWFLAKMAEVSDSPVDVMFVGDGALEGQGQTLIARRVQNVVTRALRDLYPVALGSQYACNYIPAYYDTASVVSPWVIAGGTTQKTSAVTGLGQKVLVLNGSGDKATITFNGTGIDIYNMEGAGLGAWYYRVDGGASVAVPAGAGGSFSSTGTQAIRNLDGGRHTVEVGWSSGGAVYIEGAVIYNDDETKGVRSWDNTKYGSRTSDWVAFSQAQANPWGRVTSIAPSLFVIMLGHNDWAANVPVATFKSNLQSIIALCHGSNPDAPVMIVGGYTPKDGTAPAPTTPWSQYVAAMKEIADADSLAFLWDVSQWFPSGATDSQSFYAADGRYLTDRGSRVLGAALARYVASGLRPTSLLEFLMQRFFKALARNPETLWYGPLTTDANGAVTSAAVMWPDGTPGTYTANTVETDGDVDGYQITYGIPTVRTYTQPTATRNSDGVVTNLPAITVS